MSSLVINPMGDSSNAGFDIIQNRIESLSGKMDKLINIQEKVLSRLDGMSQEIDDIEQDMEQIKVDKEEIHLSPRVVNQTQVMGREVRQICKEMSTIMSVVNQRSEQQAQKLEGMEKLVLSMQQVIGFIGETVKCSKVMEMMFKGPATRKTSRNKDSKGKQATKRKASTETVTKKPDKGKDHKSKDGGEKPCLGQKSLKAQKKMKPPDAADNISPKKQALLLEEVQKLNRENTEKTGQLFLQLDLESGVTPKDEQPEAPTCNLVDYVHEDSQPAVAEEREATGVIEEQIEEEETKVKAVPVDDVVQKKAAEEEKPKVPEEQQKENISASEEQIEDSKMPSSDVDEKEEIVTSDDHKDATPCTETEQDQVTETKQDKNEEREEQQKEEDDDESCEHGDWACFKADGIQIQFNLKEKLEKGKLENADEKTIDDDQSERFFIDTTPPPAAPFNHRIVSAKPNQIRNFYTINWQEVLGGGRFGQVHKCVENSSGLTLAAKVIKARSQKEKDMVKNEIQVMNNLDHANLIQLYAAYESRNDIILVLEYVGGGELFDRIIDENYTLMELDAVVFIRQICEGLQHMHKMSILHLDLKVTKINTNNIGEGSLHKL
ncbi:PREDICTED: myosin light chain kinase 3-like isoform X2 [Poecilia mexicana]|uniref:myosin light chain kinase 3-like isoform X2 n=1 Tax=Poecilia mexicana TaxID=48701 RepID=UPI00072E0605|nr:PREDICTED: myosin light chain kinase 3-like isoform X2 [Poecilia mexicana]